MLAPSQYRRLDDARILETLTRLRDRISERFPNSGLSRVAGELIALSGEVTGFVDEVQQPHWPIRLGAGVAILGMAAVVLLIASSLNWSFGIERFADLVQAADAAMGTLAFLGAIAFFLLTLETRLKRRNALTILHQLRSMAHIVDMHQLTKDPDAALHPASTASSPERSLDRRSLGRYLDYCSEMLSLIGKVAALYVQGFPDAGVLRAVDDIEDLTTSLSRKIWQKIALIESGIAPSAPGPQA
jgi:uncharacterized membrane protein